VGVYHARKNCFDGKGTLDFGEEWHSFFPLTASQKTKATTTFSATKNRELSKEVNRANPPCTITRDIVHQRGFFQEKQKKNKKRARWPRTCNAVCLSPFPPFHIDMFPLCTVLLASLQITRVSVLLTTHSLARSLIYSPLLDLCESFVCSGRSGWPWACAKMLDAGGGPCEWPLTLERKLEWRPWLRLREPTSCLPGRRDVSCQIAGDWK
jgi:hypothetical protein